jgi:ribosomal-protein-alanine N-acetyltransferase
LWGDPEVTALIGGPFDEEQVQARLRAEIAGMDAHSSPILADLPPARRRTRRLRPYRNRIEDRIYEIGFHLRPPCWGRGLAQEAARAVIVFAFETLRARALFAGHHPRNSGSRRVLDKLGFRHTHDELYPPTGLESPLLLITTYDLPPPALS